MTFQALSQQYTQYEQRLFALALSFTKNEQDARDLLQETSLRIFKHAQSFKAGTNFYAWTSVILRNVFINQRRRNSRWQKRVNEGVVNIHLGRAQETNLGELSLYHDNIYEYINELNDLLRIPFLMLYEGYAYKEIAEKLDCPIGTIKSRVFMARKKLQQRIQEDKAKVA